MKDSEVENIEDYSIVQLNLHTFIKCPSDVRVADLDFEIAEAMKSLVADRQDVAECGCTPHVVCPEHFIEAVRSILEIMHGEHWVVASHEVIEEENIEG